MKQIEILELEDKVIIFNPVELKTEVKDDIVTVNIFQSTETKSKQNEVRVK